MADDFTFEFAQENERHVLSTSNKNWSLELNLVSWGGRPAKYDIRSWAPDHTKMGKGLTLTKEELKALKDTLNKMDL